MKSLNKITIYPNSVEACYCTLTAGLNLQGAGLPSITEAPKRSAILAAWYFLNVILDPALAG